VFSVTIFNNSFLRKMPEIDEINKCFGYGLACCATGYIGGTIICWTFVGGSIVLGLYRENESFLTSFRRAVFGFLEKKSIPLAIAVSGLSFGFIHVLSGDFVQLIVYGSLGLALAYTYYKSNKNIMTVITIHIIYNLLVTIVMFTL